MVSDQGNQHNNGPHQDQIFDNPSVLCLALWAKNWIQFWLLGGLFISLLREYDFRSFCLSNKNNKNKNPVLNLLCLRSSRSKYNTSTINYWLVFFLHFDLKFENGVWNISCGSIGSICCAIFVTQYLAPPSIAEHY